MAIINGTNLNDNNTYQGFWPFFTYYPELKGTSFADSIFGKSGNDILQGYAGDDYLDGGTGADTMYGGAGHDVYIVDSASDRVIDSFGGSDIVNSSIDFTLPDNVETLYLTGTASSGQGNSLGNSIHSNNNSSTLKGAGGDDRLYGGNGNDVLNGGIGNDLLLGGVGDDQLTGELGNDQFDFENGIGVDTIISFNASEDRIGLDVGYSIGVFSDGLAFTNGYLNAGFYFEGSGINGNGNQGSGIYVNTSNGYIWYNPTSNISGDSYHFATVDPASIVGSVSSLSAADFVPVVYNSLH